MHHIPFTTENFALLAEKLDAGEVFVFPSDTSFGFSASPFFPEAIQKIQNIKKREEGKPFLLLMGSKNIAKKYISFSPLLAEFAEKRWEGDIPTTLITRKKAILESFFPSFSDVGIRVPTHKLLREFLLFWKKPLISTSANISGNDPIFFENHIFSDFGGEEIFFTSNGDLSQKSQSEIWKEENTKLVRVR